MRTSYQNCLGYALAFSCCLSLAFHQQRGFSQQDPIKNAPPSAALATVGGYEITEQAVLRWLRKTLPHLEADPAPTNPTQRTLSSYHPSLVKGALDHLVNRQIVLRYLRAKGIEVSRDEIKLDLEKLSDRLVQIGQSLEGYLKEEGISERELETDFEWEIAWERYLKKVLTNEYLEQHFSRHRRRFDRSEMRVAHLLIAKDDLSEADKVKLADEIYKKLQATPGDEIDQAWNSAVAQHSQAPTKTSGGEMGWIRFHEPMPGSFSAAAFSLKQGEVSPPVVTDFGVHLIRCLELREGKVGWRDAAAAVKDHAAETLFKRIANTHRAKVEIKTVSPVPLGQQ